jgi:hypothetical protein
LFRVLSFPGVVYEGLLLQAASRAKFCSSVCCLLGFLFEPEVLAFTFPETSLDTYQTTNHNIPKEVIYFKEVFLNGSLEFSENFTFEIIFSQR